MPPPHTSRKGGVFSTHAYLITDFRNGGGELRSTTTHNYKAKFSSSMPEVRLQEQNEVWHNKDQSSEKVNEQATRTNQAKSNKIKKKSKQGQFSIATAR